MDDTVPDVSTNFNQYGDYQASDLYKQIAGGTQRANPWAGILIEDIEKYRKTEQQPWDPAYDIPDDFGAQLTNSKYDMYPVEVEPPPSSSPMIIPTPDVSTQSPIIYEPQVCSPSLNYPQWMPYGMYDLGTIVQDKCKPYVVTLPITKPEFNVASPDFSQYFKDLQAYEIWDPNKNTYQKNDNVQYAGQIYYKVGNVDDQDGYISSTGFLSSPVVPMNIPPDQSILWTKGVPFLSLTVV